MSAPSASPETVLVRSQWQQGPARRRARIVRDILWAAVVALGAVAVISLLHVYAPTVRYFCWWGCPP
jgi:uncharacterized membrane protein